MNETDRELLELAAKAAGIDYKHDNADWRHADHCAFWSYDDLCTCGARWNPLTDDCDAFRLMVRLNLYGKHSVDDFLREENDSCGGDYVKATRRAIVRAAAEIGWRMTPEEGQ